MNVTTLNECNYTECDCKPSSRHYELQKQYAAYRLAVKLQHFLCVLLQQTPSAGECNVSTIRISAVWLVYLYGAVMGLYIYIYVCSLSRVCVVCIVKDLRHSRGRNQ